MYLKAIDVTGFKSFADRVRLEFKPGITEIVGPNGCGKSNIVDSIRWCIGEMSWKSLRSSSMVDVIFGGTKNRPSLHMAEVNLIFDNESKRLPVDFSEVTVTRKIFRSGESEYYLNKVQCRLRDIREMFLDTGIGGEGYAIIDQGGVEFVLKARPEERRELFEEAAGVSKYKAKRDEALKKLEKVDIDITRLNDSLALIEEQIKKLDSEARKARLHQKYKQELETAEVAMLLADIHARVSDIERENSELEPVRRQFSDLCGYVSSAEARLAALNIGLSEKRVEAQKISEKIASVKCEMGRLEEKIAGSGSNIAAIEKHIAKLEEDGARLSRRLEEIGPETDVLRAMITAQENELEVFQAQYEQKISESKSMEVEIRGLQEGITSAESRLMELMQSELDISKQTASEESNLTRDRENIAGLEKEGEKAKAAHSLLSQELVSLKTELDSKKAELEKTQSEYASAQERRKTIIARLEALSCRISETIAKKSAATATIEALRAQGNKDSYWIGAQAVLAAGINGVRGTLRHALEIKPEDRVLTEEALGRFLDSVVCDSAETAAECINLLKNSGAGRCRLIILSAVPEYAEQAQLWGLPESAKTMRERISCPPEYERLVNYLLKSVFVSSGE